MHRGIVAVGVGTLLVAGAGAFHATSSNILPSLKIFPIAGTALSPADDRAVLESRAKAYWRARAGGEMDTAFAYEDPVRQKAFGKREYRKKVDSAFQWKGVEVVGGNIWPEGELADVRINVHYQAPIAGTVMEVTSEKIDDWQKLDGVWYHVLDLYPIGTGQKSTIPGTTPKGAVLAQKGGPAS